MSRDLDLVSVEWVKSSYSDANGGNCIEFSRARCTAHGLVPIRDSKVPDGDVITVPAAGWSSFLQAVKNGEFAV